MNKNSKQLRAKLLKKATRFNGINENVPTHGFHNSPHGAFKVRRIAPVGGKTVYKKKSKPFPKVNDGPTLAEQRKFLGY